MLRFSLSRTAKRPAPGAAQTVQRKGIWIAMALLMFVALYGGTKWREQKLQFGAPADQGMVDNRITDPKAKPDEKLIMPGDLKLPEAKPMFADEGRVLFGGVRSKTFADLEDDTVFRSTENDAFFTLLKVLQDADERDVELASIGRKTFVQLFQQSDDYRGEIVTVGGVVERVIPQTKPLANKQGIEKYYELWIRPDGGRLPIVAEVLELPKDYPAGTRPAVDVTGFFYKRLGYASEEKASGNAADTGLKNVFRSSPLVLAKTLKLRPIAASAAAADDDGPAFLAGARLPFPSKYVLPVMGIGMIVLVALAAWAFKLSRTSVMAQGPIIGRHRRSDEPAEPVNLNSLNLEP
jgi:hypothetical protein